MTPSLQMAINGLESYPQIAGTIVAPSKGIRCKQVKDGADVPCGVMAFTMNIFFSDTATRSPKNNQTAS